MATILTSAPNADGLRPSAPGYRVLDRWGEPDVYAAVRVTPPDEPLLLVLYGAQDLAAAYRGVCSQRLPLLLDEGQTPSGKCFLVTERPRGVVLAATPLPARRIAEVGAQVCEGLLALSRGGLAHVALGAGGIVVGAGDELDVKLVVTPAPGPPDEPADVAGLAALLLAALSPSTDDPLGSALHRALDDAPTRYAGLEALAAALRDLASPAAKDASTRTPHSAFHPTMGSEAQLETSETLVPPKAPGTLLGSYRLQEVLGEGGMGIVYLAEHVRLGRRVAVKLLRSEFGGDALAVSRFFAEARAVNRIQHDNIVEITDFVENPTGDNYYIMEFLPGLNLEELVDRDGHLQVSRALGITVQVCSALSAVHDAGIVHRDLKPENVFLTERGGQKDYVKLLDFGIAKLGIKDEGFSTHKTGVGIILGTPEYMSPEQASGVPVDHRSDIYAVGLMLYELIAQQNAFGGDNFGEMLVARLSSTPPLPSTVAPQPVPRELDELIMQCLRMSRDERPQTIREVESRLRAIAAAYDCDLESFVEQAPPATLTRNRVVIAATLGGALLLGGVGLARFRDAPVHHEPAAAVNAPVRAVAPPEPPARAADPVVAEPVVADPPDKANEPPAGVHAAHPHAAKHGRHWLDGPSRRAVIDPFK